MHGGAEPSVRRGTSGTLRLPEGTDVSCPVVTGVSCFQCLVPLTRTATANRQWTRRTPEVSAVFQSPRLIVQQEHSRNTASSIANFLEAARLSLCCQVA